MQSMTTAKCLTYNKSGWALFSYIIQITIQSAWHCITINFSLLTSDGYCLIFVNIKKHWYIFQNSILWYDISRDLIGCAVLNLAYTGGLWFVQTHFSINTGFFHYLLWLATYFKPHVCGWEIQHSYKFTKKIVISYQKVSTSVNFSQYRFENPGIAHHYLTTVW